MAMLGSAAGRHAGERNCDNAATSKRHATTTCGVATALSSRLQPDAGCFTVAASLLGADSAVAHELVDGFREAVS